MDKRFHRRICAEFLDLLENNGMPADDKMRRLVEFFFSTERHLSVDDLVEYTKKNRIDVSAEEIRRTVRLLVEYGFAAEKRFDDGSVRYEHLHLNEHHDHFCCTKCGRIIEFFSSQLEELQLEQARQSGFHAFSHRLQINGLCKSCFGSSRIHLPLAMVETGGKFRVVEIRGEAWTGMGWHGGRKRFQDLGLVADTAGEVLSNQGGMTVVQLGENRLALRRGDAQKIMVTLTN